MPRQRLRLRHLSAPLTFSFSTTCTEQTSTGYETRFHAVHSPGLLTSSYQIIDKLDDYVDRVRHAFPNIDERSPREKACLVAEFLLSNKLVAMPEGSDYHQINNNFLGQALFSQEKNSLPIITAIIYCYIARVLGLRAGPCNFPFHVHAIVQPPVGMDLDGNALSSNNVDHPKLFMDPFRASTPIPISSLYDQLRFLDHQMPITNRDDYLSASTPRDITVRCACNIINSLRRSANTFSDPPIHSFSAKYAAQWAFVLLTNDNFDLQRHSRVLMDLFIEQFPYDLRLIEKHILPLFGNDSSGQILRCRQLRIDDQLGPATRTRRLNNSDPCAQDFASVKFHIGHIFRHKRHNYTAVVTGWDSECDATEEWIWRMRIDSLAGGRTQAFYHAL